MDLELLQFANLKSAEIVAKSLLTKCLPFETKEQLASYIAAKLNLGSKDEILTFIIRTCLITLQAHKKQVQCSVPRKKSVSVSVMNLANLQEPIVRQLNKL